MSTLPVITIGSEVLDAHGRYWTCLSPLIPGICDGLFRAERPGGGQQYGANLPGPLVVMPR